MKIGEGFINALQWITKTFSNSIFAKLAGVGSKAQDVYNNHLDSWLNSQSGAHLTGSQVEANEMQMQNAEDIYQREVTGMQKAGLNPALMYQHGASPSSPSVQGNVGGTSLSDILQLAMLPQQLKLLKAQVRNVDADTSNTEANTERTSAETERTRLLTPAEFSDILSQIDYRASNITRNEAASALDFANVALINVDLHTRDLYNRLNLRLMEANVAKSEAERDNILQSTENLKREFALSFAQEALMKAQAGLLSQETVSELIRQDVLSYDVQRGEYEAKLTEYNYDHADGNRIWNRLQTGASILRDVGIGVGTVVSAYSKVPNVAQSKAAGEIITDTAQDTYNAKGVRVKTVVTHSKTKK